MPIILSRKETNDSYDQKLPIITFTSLFEPAEAEGSLRVIDEIEKRKRCPGLFFYNACQVALVACSRKEAMLTVNCK